jgi:hypothetical protein
VIPVLVVRPVSVGIEVQDAIEAPRDVTEVAVMDAIEVEGLDAAGVAATDVGTPEAVAAVVDEFPVQGEFVVAQGGPAIGLVAVEVVAGPVEFVAARGGRAIGLVAVEVVAVPVESRFVWGAAGVE